MRPRPRLSIVVPAYNEEVIIGRLIESVRRDVTALGLSWELVIADDGSTDGTRAVVAQAAGDDDRIRLLALEHRGKGAAVRHGFMAAQGEWVFMADADLSMPWDNLPRFFDQTSGPAAPQILIASRVAPGAERTGEAASRRVSGRIFNWLVQIIALPGIHDSQCGYKLLSAEAISALTPHLTLDGFAFDVELLFLARRAGFRIREVGIVCHCRRESHVRFRLGVVAVLDVLRVRWNALRGQYRSVLRTSPREA